MNLADVIHGPWAITDEAYSAIREVYGRHARGETPDLSAIEAALGRPLSNNPPTTYDLADGIATIELNGVLGKRMNLFTAISGGTSTEIFRSQLEQALAAPDVRGIVLSIDSPGGTVDGTQQAADLIFAARDVKPIVAVADGMVASAAYWVGSAASQLYLADLTTLAGSIGVKGQHVDRSAADAASGVKRTDLVAGKYKALGSDTGPLSADDKALLEARLNQLYTVFVDNVARNLGLPAARVAADMADGRVFVGQSAVDAGLAHGIATIDQIRQRMIAGQFQPGRPKAQAPRQENNMTLEQLKTQHPTLVAEIETAARAQGETAGRTAGHAAGLTEGATAELARIRDVESQALAGHEQLVATLKFDGKTTGPQAAVAILQAEKAKGGAHLEKLRADAAAAALVGATNAPPAKASPAVDPSKSIEEQCKAAWDSDAKIRAEFLTLAAYTGFRRAEAAGGIRNIGSRAAA